MRAKLIDGALVIAPRKLTVEMTVEIDGEPVTGLYTVYNPTDEQYTAQGWLPVMETPAPDDAPGGYHYEASYTEGEGEIVQSWELVEDSDEISADEALEIIMGGAI